MKLLVTAWTGLLLLHVVSGANHQCEYQGKTYSEGEDLPTHRMCLNCKCTPDFEEPNKQVCAVIECPEAEAGCVPVYNDTECCPVSYNCERSEAAVKCNRRYFQHYEVKECTPEFEGGNECPKKFNCPEEVKVDETGCHFHGHKFGIGENIDTGNPCQICSCQRGWEGVEISCISVECPSDHGPPLNSSCREVYEPGKCCAVRTECDAEGKKKTEKVCEYGGKAYHLGEKIFPKEDPCLVCRCTENWTGVNENSCDRLVCALENERKKLAQGCVPIYNEATCCPFDFFCGLPDEELLNQTTPLPSTQDLESGNFCEFQGRHYAIGEVLNNWHQPDCFTCTCLTPPDITCIRKECPPPPNYDYENCKPIYILGACCPIYDCKPKDKCPLVVCGTFCRLVSGPNGCPICKCEGPCTPPKCGIGCLVEYNPATGPCPYCVCPNPDIPGVPIVQCSPPKCDPGCVMNYLTKPCPSCACPGTGSIQCSSPKCNPGCTLDSKAKPCPVCKCKDVPAPQCSPVKCESHCQMVQGSDGCPSCKCPECIIPHCEGCILEMDAKPCPVCLCNSAQRRNSLQLSDPFCSELQCGPGCRRDLTPATPPERCPKCKCMDQSGEHRICPAIHCEFPCVLERFSEHGCPTCICNPPPCPDLECPDGPAPGKLDWERCPSCLSADPKERCLDHRCYNYCRRRGATGGACQGNFCVCDKAVSSEPSLETGGCVDHICNMMCKRAGHKGGSCHGDTCVCYKGDSNESSLQLSHCQDHICDSLCHQRGFNGGYCHADLCVCNKAVFNDQSLQSGRCIDHVCNMMCKRSGHKGGSCHGDTCVCYKGDKPSLRDNGCPDDYLCNDSCKRRGHKSGKCHGNTCICH